MAKSVKEKQEGEGRSGKGKIREGREGRGGRVTASEPKSLKLRFVFFVFLKSGFTKVFNVIFGGVA